MASLSRPKWEGCHCQDVSDCSCLMEHLLTEIVWVLDEILAKVGGDG